MCQRGSGVMRLVWRPDGIFRTVQQAAFVLGEFRGEELNRTKFIGAWQLMKRGKKLGKLHGGSLMVSKRSFKRLGDPFAIVRCHGFRERRGVGTGRLTRGL